MEVKKNNGKLEPINISKVINVLQKAKASLSDNLIPNDEIRAVANMAICKARAKYNIKAEPIPTTTIQSCVTKVLMERGLYSLAEKYIVGCYEKKLLRGQKELDRSILEVIDNKNTEVATENSNKNSALLSTQRDYMAGEVSKDITRRLLLTDELCEAHDKGKIHIHDMDYMVQHEHNCFAGSTRFITNKGVCKFNEFKDGDLVIIKDKDGYLRKATVKNYGKGSLNKITLKSGRRETSILATSNHRWILSDGSVTTNVSVGDTLYGLRDSTEVDWDNLNDEEIEAFTLGFIIGDGVDHSSHTKVRLCGDKLKYLNLFLAVGYHVVCKFDNNDVVLSRKKAIKQDFINGKGWRFLSAHLQAFVFKGYYAADGALSSNRLSTSDERLKLLIEETSGLAGYFISSFAEKRRDTNYKKDATLYSYHFVVRQPNNMLWKVTEIKKSFRTDAELWCVEEPVTHSFVLDGGIVTGNCCLINLEDMLQNGTVINDVKIEKPRSLQTAATVMTQISACVASGQYGLI